VNHARWLAGVVLAGLSLGAGPVERGRPFVPMNERTVEALKADLDHENRAVRAEAAWGLGLLQRADAAERILALLDEAQPPTVRLAAAEALGRMGHTPAAPRLAALAASKADPDVRRAALKALVRMNAPQAPDALRRAARDADAELRRCAARLLPEAVPDPSAPLLALLKDPDDGVRRQALASLAHLWKERPKAAPVSAAPQLVALLADAEPMIRAAACGALARLAAADAARVLVARLDDPHYLVRRAAARAVGVRGETTASAPLVSRLSDGDETVREAACWALGQIRPRIGIRPLADRLEDRWPEVRDAAKKALVRYPVAQALAAVAEKLLHSPTVEARRRAAWVLAEWGDPSVGDAAAQALADRDMFVRAEALRALRRADDRRAVPHALKVLAWERRWVPLPNEVLEAYQVAGHFKDKAFVPLILQRLRLAPRWESFMQQEGGPPTPTSDILGALRAAGRFKRPEMTALLRSATGDPWVGEEAKKALAMAEGRTYVPPPPPPPGRNLMMFYIICLEDADPS